MSGRNPGRDMAAHDPDKARRDRERRIEFLLRRLPLRLQPTVRRLRHPSARWLRLCAGVLLILGGLLSILPGNPGCGCCRSVCCCWRRM